MGHSYETPEGEKLPGVGIFDLYTKPRKPDEERLIGNVLVCVKAPEAGETREIVGFENHGGRTYLGQDLKPLGEVVVGHGNNGKDGTEGARRLNAYGTYLHGSLLPIGSHGVLDGAVVWSAPRGAGCEPGPLRRQRGCHRDGGTHPGGRQP
jgi:CobQ-like glutamine amidotransferase family enzyme